MLENKPTVTPSENPSFTFLQVKDVLVSSLQNEKFEAVWTTVFADEQSMKLWTNENSLSVHEKCLFVLWEVWPYFPFL